jgi:hypothetical protein
MYPATLHGHVVAAAEIVCGLAFIAILTGLTFVRFSRPRAKLVFAANPVVAMHNGRPTLMVRVGNGRGAMLADATAKLNVLITETTAKGKPFHRGQELRLERAHIPIFPLFWTLMHVLDERSPLHGYDAERAIETDVQVFVMLQARDPTLAAMVHEIRNYRAQDIRFGMRYTDAVTSAEDGTPVLDLTRIGALESDVATARNRVGRSGKRNANRCFGPVLWSKRGPMPGTMERACSRQPGAELFRRAPPSAGSACPPVAWSPLPRRTLPKRFHRGATCCAATAGAGPGAQSLSGVLREALASWAPAPALERPVF